LFTQPFVPGTMCDENSFGKSVSSSVSESIRKSELSTEPRPSSALNISLALASDTGRGVPCLQDSRPSRPRFICPIASIIAFGTTLAQLARSGRSAGSLGKVRYSTIMASKMPGHSLERLSADKPFDEGDGRSPP
jgi:hypothetical protein